MTQDSALCLFIPKHIIPNYGKSIDVAIKGL